MGAKKRTEIGNLAVVTGAGSGIGLATALRLAAGGAHVVCADLGDRGALAVAAIEDAGGTGEHAALDVARREDWSVLADRLHEHPLALTALVNNAGITRDSTLLKMTDAQFDSVIGVHLKGAWLGCQMMIPLMKDAGGGAIVNVSSTGRHGSFGQTNYAAAKAGIVGLTRTVALETARYGIRCNAVAPGAVNTPMLENVPERTKQAWLDSIALGRFAEPIEIANTIAFLLSPDSSYVTGHILDVTGLEQHP
jgi:3-oxoacyl-[acyl-carrier protein] reductase